MQFEGAVVKEQGITFAIVVVKKHVLDSSMECNDARRNFSGFFPGVPLVLMAQDGRGVPEYQSRPDIVRFLASIHFSRIPWKKYSFN